LRPSEWKSGANAWLIDAVGEAEGVTAALRWLIAGQFKDEPLKMIAQNENGTARITTVKAMLAEAEQAKGDV
jgi:hemolysin-activating ACP:hemolysin acyltransferase